MHVPIEWPRVDEIRVHRYNRLYACNGLSFQAQGHTYQMAFLPKVSDNYQGAFSLILSIGEHCFIVELDSLPFAEAIASLLGEVFLQSLPQELATAVLTEVLSLPLSQLGGLLGTSVQLQSVEEQAQPAFIRDRAVVPFHMKGEHIQHQGRLIFPTSSWPTLITLLERSTPNRMSAWNHLPIQIQLIAGNTQLPAKELASLEPGDLVFMDVAWVGEQVGLLLPGGTFWRARVEDKLILEDEMEMPEFFEDATTDVHTNPTLELVFEAGRRDISLRELSSLDRGSVIECGVNLDQGVRLKVNGVDAGRGELVALGDKLAVRILELKRSEETAVAGAV